MKELAEKLYNSYFEEYKEIMNIWKEIEKKAQINLTLAGGLLTLIGAYVNSLQAPTAPKVDCVQTILVIALVGCTLVLAVFSFLVLPPKSLDMPPMGTEVSANFEKVLKSKKTGKQLDDLELKLYETLNSKWPAVNQAHHLASESKAAYLEKANQSFMVTLIILGLLIVMRVT